MSQPIGTGATAVYGLRHVHVFLVLASYGVDRGTAAHMRAERAWLDSRERFVAQELAQNVTVRLYEDVGPLTTPSG